jgi:hypothetical protein
VPPHERLCLVLVGLKHRWMRCGLPAGHPWEQDGERYVVCTIHARYDGSRLPLTLRDLMPQRNSPKAARD